ncbi:hypothetical protein C8J56DRAFT_1164404 [Mycena floridula]|nr:hypothetical protein C8J56DRAFT_837820 [Mycena floridula]KAJ7588528.1 hypothetical protein C8J56DRAFT_1164404 [Mycena floridula]
MLSAKFILAAFSTFVAVSAAPSAAAVPSAGALARRSEQASPTIIICSGSVSPAQGCVTTPVVSASCVNLTGGLSFLDKEISGASIPAGFVCTFFEDFGCLNGGVNHHDVAVLTGGTYSMFNVQGIAGTQSFNDLTSSISCSPV